MEQYICLKKSEVVIGADDESSSDDDDGDDDDEDIEQVDGTDEDGEGREKIEVVAHTPEEVQHDKVRLPSTNNIHSKCRSCAGRTTEASNRIHGCFER